MRQNRDIARANSTQSIRIRNLENEVSRLLAENLSLREEVLQLRGDLEKSQGHQMAEHTNTVRTQMEAKVWELNALVKSLGEGPPPEKSPKLGKVVNKSPKRSPDQRNWCTLSEAFESQEGRLPPILEDKAFPRRTLEYVFIYDDTS